LKCPKSWLIGACVRIVLRATDICMLALKELEHHGMISFGDDGFSLRPNGAYTLFTTGSGDVGGDRDGWIYCKFVVDNEAIGKCMARYYLQFDTMKLFSELQPAAPIAEILLMISRAQELSGTTLVRCICSPYKLIHPNAALSLSLSPCGG